MANLHAFGDKIMGGASTGGGHTIWDRLKTALTQRSILQFGGTLQVTDNPTDSATVVDDSAYEINWNDWNAMSAVEQDAFCELHPKVDILDPPSVDGTISAELIKKLWENPSPTSAFAAQDVTLSSSDYDLLLFVTNQSSSFNRAISFWATKGQDAFLSFSSTRGSSATYTTTYTRLATRNSDTSYTITGGSTQNSNAALSADNSCLIPIAIYGIKSTINLKLSAIASDVNTAADHCMLSDGVTSVEDKIDELNEDIDTEFAYVTDTQTYTLPAVGDSVDVQKTVEKMGYTPIGIINVMSNTQKATSEGCIVNGKAFISIINIANSSMVGQTRTAQWTTIFKKN